MTMFPLLFFGTAILALVGTAAVHFFNDWHRNSRHPGDWFSSHAWGSPSDARSPAHRLKSPL